MTQVLVENGLLSVRNIGLAAENVISFGTNLYNGPAINLPDALYQPENTDLLPDGWSCAPICAQIMDTALGKRRTLGEITRIALSCGINPDVGAERPEFATLMRQLGYKTQMAEVRYMTDFGKWYDDGWLVAGNYMEKAFDSLPGKDQSGMGHWGVYAGADYIRQQLLIFNPSLRSGRVGERVFAPMVVSFQDYQRTAIDLNAQPTLSETAFHVNSQTQYFIRHVLLVRK